VFRGERTIGGMPGAWGPIVILEYLSLLGESLRRWQAGERLTFIGTQIFKPRPRKEEV